MKVSLITVCHKSKEDIARFVISFLKYHSLDSDQIKYEFVFVENSGQPELREVVAPLSEGGYDVLVVDSKNLGFGIACNLGVKHSTGALLVFVNPDIQFLSNLDLLAEFATNASWGTVRQLTPLGKKYSIDFLPEYKTLFFELIQGSRLVNKYPNIFLKRCYVVGSFLVVEREIFARSGGFNPTFFLYYEEAELCRRLQWISGPPLIESRVFVVHEGFGSHETPEHSLKYEAEGFLAYCHVTSQLHLIKSRLSQFLVLGLFSKIAKQRYSILKSLVSKKVFE
jgi:GT2 family glycosyltransferase